MLDPITPGRCLRTVNVRTHNPRPVIDGGKNQDRCTTCQRKHVIKRLRETVDILDWQHRTLNQRHGYPRASISKSINGITRRTPTARATHRRSKKFIRMLLRANYICAPKNLYSRFINPSPDDLFIKENPIPVHLI